MKTFKILGLLLTYPWDELQAHMSELESTLRAEGILRKKDLSRLIPFMARLADEDLLTLQEEYVSLFDRGRGNSLHMFEHVHGESRDRGQAMIDLSNMYRSKGLELDAAELPDYVPLFLEYISLCPFGEAQALLGEAVHIFATIGERLRAKNSDYAIIFDVLQTLTAVKVDPAVLEAARKAFEMDEDSLEELDREWEEAPAFDNTSAKMCQSCELNPLASQNSDAQSANTSSL